MKKKKNKKVKETLAGIWVQFSVAFMVSILYPAKSFLQD